MKSRYFKRRTNMNNNLKKRLSNLILRVIGKFLKFLLQNSFKSFYSIFTLLVIISLSFSSCFQLNKNLSENDPSLEKLSEPLECEIVKVSIHTGEECEMDYNCIQADGRTLEMEGEVPDFETKFRALRGSDKMKLIAVNNIFRNKDKLVFTKNSEWSISMITDREKVSNLRASTGTSTVLVLHVSATDSSHPLTSSKIADGIFGVHGDTTTLASQTKKCSYNQKIFAPASGEHIVNGVLKITLNMNVVGVGSNAVHNAAVQEANRVLGYTIKNKFDKVIVSLPPEVNFKGAAAYAYVNGWLSVYRYNYTTKLPVLMHEIGHNLGLSHSGYGDFSYADKSGYMGIPYKNHLCYNAAKSSELGWYQDREVTLTSETWSGKLIGLTDYKAATSEHNVILTIKKPNSTSALYLTFNRKEGINIETRMFEDRVTIVEDSNPNKYGTSWALGSLGVNDTYTYTDFGGTGKDLVITVDEIVFNTSIDYAIVSVINEDGQKDDQRPTAPLDLYSSNETSNSVSLNWSASSDNVSVSGYNIYRNGSYLSFVTGTSANITGLSSSTTYNFYVKAKDETGNLSDPSDTVSVTTSGHVKITATSKEKTDMGCGTFLK